jgi:hypothetical protein
MEIRSYDGSHGQIACADHLPQKQVRSHPKVFRLSLAMNDLRCANPEHMRLVVKPVAKVSSRFNIVQQPDFVS